MKIWIALIVVGCMSWGVAAENALEIQNSALRLSADRLTLPGWKVIAGRWYNEAGPQGLNALKLVLRNNAGSRYQAVLGGTLQDPAPGNYRFGIMIRLDSDAVDTVQFYNPQTLASGQQPKVRYVVLNKSNYPAVGEWKQIHAQFTVPENCVKCTFGLEIRSVSPASVAFAAPELSVEK